MLVQAEHLKSGCWLDGFPLGAVRKDLGSGLLPSWFAVSLWHSLVSSFFTEQSPVCTCDSGAVKSELLPFTVIWSKILGYRGLNRPRQQVIALEETHWWERWAAVWCLKLSFICSVFQVCTYHSLPPSWSLTSPSTFTWFWELDSGCQAPAASTSTAGPSCQPMNYFIWIKVGFLFCWGWGKKTNKPWKAWLKEADIKWRAKTAI